MQVLHDVAPNKNWSMDKKQFLDEVEHAMSWIKETGVWVIDKGEGWDR